jgi:hypothetical protein
VAWTTVLCYVLIALERQRIRQRLHRSSWTRPTSSGSSDFDRGCWMGQSQGWCRRGRGGCPVSCAPQQLLSHIRAETLGHRTFYLRHLLHPCFSPSFTNCLSFGASVLAKSSSSHLITLLLDSCVLSELSLTVVVSVPRKPKDGRHSKLSRCKLRRKERESGRKSQRT